MNPRSRTRVNANRYHRLTLGLFAVLLLLLVVAACGGGGDASSGTNSSAGNDTLSGTLTYASYGGEFQEAETEAWLDPFQEENPGVTINQEEPIELAKLLAMQQSGNVSWNIISTGNNDPYSNSIMEPIDCKIVDCTQFPKDTNFDGYRAPYYTYAVVLTYNEDDVGSSPPQGWRDFFDTTKYPGKRALYSYINSATLEPALLAAGVPPDEIYPMNRKLAFEKLESIQDDIIWYQTGAECTQLVSSGEAVMGNCWNGRLFEAEQEGKAARGQWNECILQVGALAIPKGSSDVPLAQKLVAYITSPEHNAQLSHYIAYGPAVDGALSKVDPAMKQSLPTAAGRDCIALDGSYFQKAGPEIEAELAEFARE